MDESAHPTKPAPESPTPEVEQLLRLLELETAARRNRGAGRPKAFQGVSFRYGSLIVIIVFALGSVGIMEWVIAQLPKPRPAAVPGFSVLRNGSGNGGEPGSK